MSVYLENMDSLISYDEDLLNRLTNARNTDELHNAKHSILRDFRDIYAFDASYPKENIAAGHGFLSWQRVQEVPFYNLSDA